jgi:hypothetical protein
MTDSDRALAYGRIRTGAGLIGAAIVLAYLLPLGIGWVVPTMAHYLWFIVSIPLAFMVGGQGLALIAHGVAMLFRSE